jgi:tRNA (adenine57-N1/adenine58-N1)-methyltransferase
MRILVDGRGKKRLVEEGEEVHTDRGVVSLGSQASGRVRSHLGEAFVFFEPRLVDLYERMPRAGSFLLKKDLGAILAYTGIGTGDRVVDAGTGTGSMALYLAHLVRPTGKVFTYEVQEEIAEVARGNLSRSGLEEYVELRVQDVAEGMERDVDVVVLDLAQPWKVFPEAHAALRPGGFLCVYTPYVEGARRAVEALSAGGFREIRTLEILEREMEFRSQGTRPKTRMIGHTAYLTFARRYPSGERKI